MSEPPIKLLDVVALLRDRPETGLLKGQVGTVVEVLAPEVYEVEFVAETGETFGLEELHRADLLLLRHRVESAA